MEENTEQGILVVHLYKEKEKLEVPVKAGETLTAEDVCIRVAKNLNFRPITLHLFGLRTLQPELWLPDCYVFTAGRNYEVEFRLRFKVPTITNLSRLDENAFDYIFHQVRGDLLQSKVLETKVLVISNVFDDRTCLSEKVKVN